MKIILWIILIVFLIVVIIFMFFIYDFVFLTEYCETSSDCKYVCGCGCINKDRNCPYGKTSDCEVPSSPCRCVNNLCID